MTLHPVNRTVTRYDWALYLQAISKAKQQYRKDKNDKQFKAACMTAYTKLIESPDTEIITVWTNAPAK